VKSYTDNLLEKSSKKYVYHAVADIPYGIPLGDKNLNTSKLYGYIKDTYSGKIVVT
jgi:hypothetical protein